MKATKTERKKEDEGLVDELLRLIGLVTVRFVQCELLASTLVDRTTNSRRGLEIYQKKNGAKQKFKEYTSALRSCMVKSNRPDIRNIVIIDVIQWIADVDTCRDSRNEVVHSFWSLVTINKDNKDVVSRLNYANGNPRISFENEESLDAILRQLDEIYLKGSLLLV